MTLDVRHTHRTACYCSASVRCSQAEKVEIIHLVKHSEFSISRNLEELDGPHSTWYRWYKRYQNEALDGVVDLKPKPWQFWNRIPAIVRDQVMQFALERTQIKHPGSWLGISQIRKAISS